MNKPTAPQHAGEDRFDEVLALIHSARQRAAQAVNTQLIELYWQVGAYISRKLGRAEWGDSVVTQLAEHLALTQPGLRGFARPNLFRMRQFYEASRRRKSLTTGETIAMDPQHHHSQPEQAPGRARVLSTYGDSGEVVKA